MGVKIDLQLKYQMIRKILMCINGSSKFKGIESELEVVLVCGETGSRVED